MELSAAVAGPDHEKARITEDSFAPGAKVSEVARKQGVNSKIWIALVAAMK